MLFSGGPKEKVTIKQPSTNMRADSVISVGTLLVVKVTQASLESNSPTLARPRKILSREIRDGETVVAGRLGVYQLPTMMNPIGVLSGMRR
jgi:hypothetical protein